MPFMPVDIVRLFDSDLYALSTGEEFKAAFTLWGKAFLQIPAGSLPNDERILAHLSGAGSRWPRVRDMAIKGWIKCSDGRLYHAVVSEKALTAWEGRKAQRARTEAARAARLAKNKARGAAPTSDITDQLNGNTKGTTGDVTKSVTDNVTGSKGESEGEGKGKLSKKDSGATHLPPAGARALLFGWGLDTLKAMTGRSESSLRSWIGKMLRALRDDAAVLNSLIEQAVDERPADPTSWLSGAVAHRAGIGRAGKPEAFGHIAETPESEFVRRVLAGEIDQQGRPIGPSGGRPDDGFQGTTIDGEAA
jgi:hypothetical protein